MPGFDGSGPQGSGPMTGGRRGLYNTTNTAYGMTFSRSIGFGRGRGFRSGVGYGRGRGYGWYGYRPVYGPAYPVDSQDEIDMLKAEAENLKSAVDAVNKRIAELEKNPS